MCPNPQFWSHLLKKSLIDYLWLCAVHMIFLFHLFFLFHDFFIYIFLLCQNIVTKALIGIVLKNKK